MFLLIVIKLIVGPSTGGVDLAGTGVSKDRKIGIFLGVLASLGLVVGAYLNAKETGDLPGALGGRQGRFGATAAANRLTSLTQARGSAGGSSAGPGRGSPMSSVRPRARSWWSAWSRSSSRRPTTIRRRPASCSPCC